MCGLNVLRFCICMHLSCDKDVICTAECFWSTTNQKTFSFSCILMTFNSFALWFRVRFLTKMVMSWWDFFVAIVEFWVLLYTYVMMACFIFSNSCLSLIFSNLLPPKWLLLNIADVLKASSGSLVMTESRLVIWLVHKLPSIRLWIMCIKQAGFTLSYQTSSGSHRYFCQEKAVTQEVLRRETQECDIFHYDAL